MNPTDTLQPAPRKKRARRTEAQWHALLDAFDKGELTVKQFCVEHDLTTSNFHLWRSKRRAMKKEQFVPLVAPAVRRSGWDIELSLGEDITLRLRRN